MTSCGRPRCRRVWSTSSPATAAPGLKSSSIPTLTKWPSPARRRWGRDRAVAGTDKKLTLELGGKAANIIFDDAALDQAVGDRERHLLQPGHVCCAGSRLLVQESIYEQTVEAEAADGDGAGGRPARQGPDVGAINSQQQLEKIKSWWPRARRKARDLPAAVPPSREGLVVRSDGLHERGPELPDRAGGDLWPGPWPC